MGCYVSDARYKAGIAQGIKFHSAGCGHTFPWPDELPCGTRSSGHLARCTACPKSAPAHVATTWTRYGSEPRCLACAKREAGVRDIPAAR